MRWMISGSEYGNIVLSFDEYALLYSLAYFLYSFV